MKAILSRRRVLALLASALVVVACSRRDAPSEPVWGKEPCANCKMLVSDKRYAAQILDDAGEHKFFDDIGCMVVWMDAHPSPRAWVRDPVSGAWLDARTAHYVQDAHTPMDFGFEARSTGDLDFDGVRNATMAKKRSSR